MKHKTYDKAQIFLAACGMFISAFPAMAHSQAVNIAWNKPVTFNVKPNYSYSTDPDDAIQLTDGKLSSEGAVQEVEKTRAIWVQKGTVGWQNKNPVVITMDLGTIQPIAGISFSTAGGTSGVFWPTSIHVAVSDDNKTWHYAGNMVQLSRKNGVPPAKGYAAFKYMVGDLQTKGRYITFGVESVPFVFCDEIEVYRGQDAWLTQPTPGKVVAPMQEFVPEMVVTSAAQRRINDDIAEIQSSIEATNLSPERKKILSERLSRASQNASQMEALPRDFRTILPLNDIHRDVLAVRGEFLAAQGLKPLLAWKQHRYAWLPLLAKPDEQAKAELDFSMLKNQFRSDNILLTNASGQPQQVTLRLQNAPQNAGDGWLQVASVAWTDTAQGIPVADALFPLQPENGVYTVEIPAGMTRKVWFTVDSSRLAAGASRSMIEVKSGRQQYAVPLNLNISGVVMKRPRLSLGMWDYTNRIIYGITEQNRPAAIALMRSHFVDTTWGNRSALPWPGAADFDAQGNYKTKPVFTNFDQWVALWPGAKHFFVYIAADTAFAGARMGTPEFHARVGSWAKALSAHMKELGLQPQQLGILINDEPHTPAQDEIIANWARAINEAAPELTLFEDPAWARPDRTKNQDAITQIDVLCPNLYIYKAGGAPVQKYFANLRAQGKALWFYQCSGPVRLYDPQLYYRYQAWNAFAEGATGQGFWSFSDTSKATSSFSEYGTSRINFAPVFFDNDTVYSSVHWDAVREGMEDYEELAMLRDAIGASGNVAWKRQAQPVLDEALNAVTGVWDRVYVWSQKSEPALADRQLYRVRAMLDSKE